MEHVSISTTATANAIATPNATAVLLLLGPHEIKILIKGIPIGFLQANNIGIAREKTLPDERLTMPHSRAELGTHGLYIL